MTSSRNPEVSVIIPTRRRPGQLGACLAGLAACAARQRGLEVIVVDDGGDTPLEPVAAPFAHRLQLRLIRHPGAGPAAARNAGAERASGRILAFTDDDCIPSPGWVAALRRAVERSPDALIGGRTANAFERNPYAAASQLLADVVRDHFGLCSAGATCFPSNNLALAAEYFHGVGGFDPTFTTSEDRDLCDRWLAGGRPLSYAPDAVVRHARWLGPASFWTQHVGYGRGAWRFHRARARRGFRLRPDPAFYARLLGLRSGVPERHARASVRALMALSQAASAAGFMLEATADWRRRRNGHAQTSAIEPFVAADAAETGRAWREPSSTTFR